MKIMALVLSLCGVTALAQEATHYCEKTALEYAVNVYKGTNELDMPLAHTVKLRWARDLEDGSVLEAFRVTTESQDYLSKMLVKVRRQRQEVPAQPENAPAAATPQCEVVDQYWVL